MKQRPICRSTASEWAALRANTPLTLSARDLANSPQRERGGIPRPRWVEAYLPLSRLLNLHVAAAAQSGERQGRVSRPAGRFGPPYVIAVAGSVAVGKSTFARILRER